MKLSLGFAVWAIGLALWPTHAISEPALVFRQTSIHVTNKSGKEISEITVRHKYSDVYKDKAVWKAIISNGKTVKLNDAEDSKKPANIRYHTGWGTTGADWWLVTWKDQDGVEYVTNPNNFRNIIDPLEKFLLGTKSTVKTLALPAAGVAGIAGGLVIDAVAESVFNTEATYDKELGVAFKQFILRGTAPVLIEIGVYDKTNNGGQGTVRLGVRSQDGGLIQGDTTFFKSISPDDLKLIKDLAQKALEEAQKRAEAELKKITDELEKRKKEAAASK